MSHECLTGGDTLERCLGLHDRNEPCLQRCHLLRGPTGGPPRPPHLGRGCSGHYLSDHSRDMHYYFLPAFVSENAVGYQKRLRRSLHYSATQSLDVLCSWRISPLTPKASSVLQTKLDRSISSATPSLASSATPSSLASPGQLRTCQR